MRILKFKEGKIVDNKGTDDRSLATEKNGGNEPFNRIRVTLTRPTQVILERAQAPTRGLPGHPNAGFPNPATLITQTLNNIKCYKFFPILISVNRALFEESKRLECNKPFDYNILIGTSPPQFKGIEPKAKHLLLTTDTEVTPTTIIGTNCQQYQLPESKWQREQLEEAIRKQKSKIKKKTNL